VFKARFRYFLGHKHPALSDIADSKATYKYRPKPTLSILGYNSYIRSREFRSRRRHAAYYFLPAGCNLHPGSRSYQVPSGSSTSNLTFRPRLRSLPLGRTLGACVTMCSSGTGGGGRRSAEKGDDVISRRRVGNPRGLLGPTSSSRRSSS